MELLKIISIAAAGATSLVLFLLDLIPSTLPPIGPAPIPIVPPAEETTLVVTETPMPPTTSEASAATAPRISQKSETKEIKEVRTPVVSSEAPATTTATSTQASSTPSIKSAPGITSVQNTKPLLTLQGDTEISTPTGASFKDPGATASDVEDGDLSNEIAYSGEVNIYTPGNYLLRYEVTDSNGAKATALTRTVVVVPPTPLPTDSQEPRYALAEEADLVLSSAEDADPTFVRASITPLHVYVGEEQTLTVQVNSETPITGVTATTELDNETLTLSLEKVSSDSSGTTFSTTWTVFDTHVRTYRTTFAAENEAGATNSLTLAWSDPCAGVTQGVNSSLSSNCAVSSVSGVDGGNLTIPGDITLTLNSGATWVWNPGTSIAVNGVIAKNSTAQMKKGYLFYSGATNDSANTSTLVYDVNSTKSGHVRAGPWFAFTALYDVNVIGLHTSNTVTIGSISNGSTVTLTSSGSGESQLEMSINSGTWSTSGSMNPGDTLAIRYRNGGEFSTTYWVQASVGGSSSIFYVTTKADPGGGGGGCKFECP